MSACKRSSGFNTRNHPLIQLRVAAGHRLLRQQPSHPLVAELMRLGSLVVDDPCQQLSLVLLLREGSLQEVVDALVDVFNFVGIDAEADWTLWF